MNTIAILNLICGLVSTKWVLDLDFSQTRQLIFMFGGFILGPIILLVLYVRHNNKTKKITLIYKKTPSIIELKI
jgi:hypothetical protein